MPEGSGFFGGLKEAESVEVDEFVDEMAEADVGVDSGELAAESVEVDEFEDVTAEADEVAQVDEPASNLSGFPFHAAPPLIAPESEAHPEKIAEVAPDEASLPRHGTNANEPLPEAGDDEANPANEKNSRYRALKALRQTLR